MKKSYKPAISRCNLLETLCRDRGKWQQTVGEICKEEEQVTQLWPVPLPAHAPGKGQDRDRAPTRPSCSGGRTTEAHGTSRAMPRHLARDWFILECGRNPKLS